MSEESIEFDVQDVTISIDKSDHIGKILVNDFSNLKETTQKPDIILTMSPGFVEPPNRGVWINDNIWVTENQIFIDKRQSLSTTSISDRIQTQVGQIGYQLSIRGDPQANTQLVDIYYDRQLTESRFEQRLLQFNNWSYMTRSEILAKDIIYNVFEPILHQKLLPNGGAFIHASSVSRGGNGILFPAWGGTGKTSVSSQLVQHYNYKFLSDDLSIINSQGKLEPYLKSIVVYPYNFENDPTAESRLFSGKGILNRMHWAANSRLKGKKGVRRRISASNYYDNLYKFHESVPLSEVVYLLRYEGDSFRVESPSPENAATRGASTIANELSPFLIETSTAIHAAEPSTWPSFAEILSQSKEIYELSFKSANIYLLYIPKNASPKQLAEFVNDCLLTSE